MGMIGIYSADGTVHRYDVFVPFLDSVSDAVIGDVEALRIVSQKPLGDFNSSLQFLDESGWRDLEVHPELSSWVTHSRFRIITRMDISDQKTPELEGEVQFSDGEFIWTYGLILEQDDSAETLTFRLRGKTKNGEQVGAVQPAAAVDSKAE